MTNPAYLVAIWLFLTGVYGVVTSRHLLHLAMCVSVAQSSTFIVLVAGLQGDGTARTLLLLDIIAQAALTGLLITLAVAAHARSGELNPRRTRAVRE